MATEKKGVWDLQQVRDQYLEGKWTYIPVANAGELWVWGLNDFGALGQNNRTYYSSPVQVPGTQWVYSSEDSYRVILATKTDNTLWVWGTNTSGNLGQSNLTHYSSPVQIPGTQWSISSKDKISGQNGSACVIKSDGTLWSWGYNSDGWLGQNDVTQYSSPVQVPGTQWESIASGYASYASYGIKTDRTLWAWGQNSQGQLAQNNRTKYSSPVQIPGTQWTQINSGYGGITLASKTDGTLWSWGYNASGELGQNDKTLRSSPVQIPGTQWELISVGNRISLATKTDGTLWLWGRNNVGQLGQNNLTEYSSPIQVPGTQWESISGSYWGSKAIKSDGTLWSWGYNPYGQLGNQTSGVPGRFSSPIQIPGTQWAFVGESSYSSNAIKRLE